MRDEPKERIHPKALSVWRATGALISGVNVLLALVLFVIVYLTNIPFWIAILAFVFVIIVAYVIIGVIPNIRYKRWRYEVNEQEIDIQHGIVVVKRTLVPMVRVQHVDTKQGPILRHYDLATVTISTAATTHEIPALSMADAGKLRDRIAELARVVDEDE